MAQPPRPSQSTTTAPRRALQVPLMYAFRDAFRSRDASRALDERTAEDERILTDRGALRRRGANEAQLKANLDIDLTNLVNTVNFGATVDLEGLKYVARSVLNYGLDDMSHLTAETIAENDTIAGLRRALEEHEPRLIGDTIKVALRGGYDDVTQRISFQVNAEMACRPVDIPLEFVAEIDVGSGKVQLSKVAGGG